MFMPYLGGMGSPATVYDFSISMRRDGMCETSPASARPVGLGRDAITTSPMSLNLCSRASRARAGDQTWEEIEDSQGQGWPLLDEWER
jgi:hypothetical protein